MREAHLVIGGGYIGCALVHALARRTEAVYVTFRALPPSRELARRASPLVFDTGASALPLPPSLPEVDALDVYCLLPPSALVTVAARQRLFEWLDALPVRRAVLSSSTGVYGDRAGSIVTAETPVAPTSDRARRLLEIEDAWLRRPRSGIVRFAGLYGPGRVIGAQAVRDGALLPGPPSALLNLLHRDDAVALLLSCLRSPAATAVEVGSDGTPIERRTYYGALARLLGAPEPRFAERADESAQGKAVDSSSTMRRLGWRPRFGDFRAGLAAALSVAPAE